MVAGPDVVRVKAVAVDSCYSAVDLAVQQQLRVAAVVKASDFCLTAVVVVEELDSKSVVEIRGIVDPAVLPPSLAAVAVVEDGQSAVDYCC